MSYENIKSILLTLLVCLSLVLTWSLWTYQPDLPEIENTEFIKDVNIGLQKEPANLILPNKILFHKNNNDYGTVKANAMNNMMKSIRKMNFDEFTDITPTIKDGYLDFVRRQEGVEVIFPTELPIETLRGIMSIEDDEIRSKSFDRIIIPVGESQEKMPVAYFVSYNSHYVYRAKLNNFSSQTFEREFFAPKYPKYFSYNIDANKSIYLPAETIEENRITYYSTNFSGEDFKDALFTDPSIVKRDVQQTGDQIYSDGSRAMYIYNNGSLLRYINPSSESTVKNNTSYGLIQRSIDFVNDHSGWTELYQLTDWNLNSQSTTFRLHINGLPVFNFGGLSRISMHWDGRNLFDIYERPLFKLQLLLDSESTKVKLPSGYSLIELLEDSPSIDPLKLEDAMIGYEMKKDPASARVTIEPIWCIKYEGVWKKVVFPEDAREQGGTFIELE